MCCEDISDKRSGSDVPGTGRAPLISQVRSAVAVGTAPLLESRQTAVTPSVDGDQTYVTASKVVHSSLTEVLSVYRACQSDVILSRCESKMAFPDLLVMTNPS